MSIESSIEEPIINNYKIANKKLKEIDPNAFCVFFPMEHMYEVWVSKPEYHAITKSYYNSVDAIKNAIDLLTAEQDYEFI